MPPGLSSFELSEGRLEVGTGHDIYSYVHMSYTYVHLPNVYIYIYIYIHNTHTHIHTYTYTHLPGFEILAPAAPSLELARSGRAVHAIGWPKYS